MSSLSQEQYDRIKWFNLAIVEHQRIGLIHAETMDKLQPILYEIEDIIVSSFSP